jgi:antitoxin (DNA-binding transcriptional repressor) of toxin-antitoxin stability system
LIQLQSQLIYGGRRMPTYTVHSAMTNLSKLIARAEAGEEIVIARGKKPVVRLIPVGVPAHVLRCRAFGALKDKLKLSDSFFEALPEDERKLWEGRED